MIIIFKSKEVMHWEFVPLNQTINGDFCCKFLVGCVTIFIQKDHNCVAIESGSCTTTAFLQKCSLHNVSHFGSRVPYLCNICILKWNWNLILEFQHFWRDSHWTATVHDKVEEQKTSREYLTYGWDHCISERGDRFERGWRPGYIGLAIIIL